MPKGECGVMMVLAVGAGVILALWGARGARS
jgi:hypothetical protein